MITLTINVESVANVLLLFDRIEIYKYNGDTTPTIPIDSAEFDPVLGVDVVNSRLDVSDIIMSVTYSQYYFDDPNGVSTDWYVSRYVNTTTSAVSGWSDPIQGQFGDLTYNPLYTPEASYSASDQLVINRIRLLIGDPKGIRREAGQEQVSSMHFDSKIYELDEKGWPLSINMYGTQYTSSYNPTVNGYKYLKFQTPIDTSAVTTISGVDYAVDIWYSTFRKSDKEIKDIYDATPPPTPLDTTTTTTEIYMLQAAYDILFSEAWNDMTEDGVIIKDDKDSYDPSPGIRNRKDMLEALKKRIDAAVKSVRLLGISGVRID